jgi:hypothetical protein
MNPSTPGGYVAERRIRRQFTTEFKVPAVKRVLDGCSLSKWQPSSVEKVAVSAEVVWLDAEAMLAV